MQWTCLTPLPGSSRDVWQKAEIPINTKDPIKPREEAGDKHTLSLCLSHTQKHTSHRLFIFCDISLPTYGVNQLTSLLQLNQISKLLFVLLLYESHPSPIRVSRAPEPTEVHFWLSFAQDVGALFTILYQHACHETTISYRCCYQYFKVHGCFFQLFPCSPITFYCIYLFFASTMRR